jgi:phosphatidate cytidylyltransferase
MRQDNHILVLLTVILLTKACDIGAYFVGSAIGKHKLIPWLSPGKSWEGLIGGVALAAILGALAAQLSFDSAGFPVWYGALVGITLGLVGQAGDLLESLLKRSTGVKNSGTLPGFGGILDLIDSPLLVAPVAYWLVMLAPAL